MNQWFVRQSYRWGLPAVALAVLVPTLVRMPAPSWTGSDILAIAFWAALIAIAEIAPLSVRLPDLRLSLTPAFELGALLCFGTVPAIGLVGLGRVTAALLRGTGPLEAASSALQSVLVIGVTGAVYFEQGGAHGSMLANAPAQLTATALAMAVFVLSHAALEAWRAAAETRRGATRAEDKRGSSPLFLTALALPVGVAFAWLEATSGPVAPACALVLFVISHGIERAPARVVGNPVASAPASHVETVRLLMSIIDAIDPYTRGHSRRIAGSAVRVARHLGLDDQELLDLEYGALLHDIGRTAIQLDFLSRPGTLEAHERAVLQTHPTVGFEIVQSLPHLHDAAEIVYAHHEQPDGRGYPRGLKGREIPRGSRIIMVTSAFDAMTHDRPFRRGLQPPAAYEELRRHSGTQFFPDVVEAFITLHQAGALDCESEEAPEAQRPHPGDGGPLHRAAA